MREIYNVNDTVIVYIQESELNDCEESDKSTDNDVNGDGIPQTYTENNLEVHWDTFSLNL